MLNWYNHLYVGDTVKKNVEIYKKKIERGKIVRGVYLITLASNGVDQLDIINCCYLIQNTLYRRCPMIVGIANGREEACELVIRMAKDCFLHTNKGDIKEYLLQG